MSAIIIVHGRPGAGKTTLQKRLSADFGLPTLARDAIKEFLADEMGSARGDSLSSQDLGQVAVKMFYTGADAFLSKDLDVLMEAAFDAPLAQKDLDGLLQKHQARILEFYCYTDEQTRARRFIARNENGLRHAVHDDHLNYNTFGKPIASDDAKFAPIQLGQVIKVDTTAFDDAGYAKIYDAVKNFLAAA